ncbi:MAG: RNA methyltransferase [Acidobacteria bacterium]|nr:RNA methyltransferase [Acidobacteriota bacterium]
MEWKQRLRIVLMRPRNALNIGAAARAMFNFGFDDLWLVDPYEPAFRRAKSAMGAARVLEQAHVTSDPAEALGEATLVVASSALQGRSTDIVQRELAPGGTVLRSHLEAGRAALLFGPEKTGLSREDLSFADWIVTIPTNPSCPSMNLGQAVAVCCYELAQQSRAVPELKTPATIPAEQRARILDVLLPILSDSGFLFDEGLEAQTQKLRRWVGRLRLAPRDGQLFLGILRQIRWRLDHPGEP